MEIHKPKPHSSIHQGTHQVTQTGPPHPPCRRLERSPSIQASPNVCPKIKLTAPLPNTHNLENTSDLLRKLEHTPILPQFTLASLVISNLYTNIPVKGTRKIIADNLSTNKVNSQAQEELLNWYDTITSQNYFSNKGKILIQQEGLAMGAPTSGIIAESFLQHLESTHINNLLSKHKIAAYFRYVDDILLIYDSLHTNISCFDDPSPSQRVTHTTGMTQLNP